jgi:WD40 repeat protein
VTHHTDWVTKVKYLDEMGSLCSSSLDKTLALYDVQRRSPVRTLVGHAKGIYRWVWVCPSQGQRVSLSGCSYRRQRLSSATRA